MPNVDPGKVEQILFAVTEQDKGVIRDKVSDETLRKDLHDYVPGRMGRLADMAGFSATKKEGINTRNPSEYDAALQTLEGLAKKEGPNQENYRWALTTLKTMKNLAENKGEKFLEGVGNPDIQKHLEKFDKDTGDYLKLNYVGAGAKMGLRSMADKVGSSRIVCNRSRVFK